MCAAQNNTAPFSYTWGIANADNIRTESVVEFSPNVNYTVSDGSVSTQLATLIIYYVDEEGCQEIWRT